MENKQYKQINETIKALFIELEPMFKEVGVLAKSIRELGYESDNNNGNENPLITLIGHLTKTSRRHDIEKAIIYNNRNKSVGTNHNGLGYVDSYSSQLTSLTSNSKYYSNVTRDEEMTRQILFDDEISQELITIVKKCNQKTLLKTISILKKFNLTKPYQSFVDENVNRIKIPIGNENTIQISLDRNYHTTFSLLDKDGEEEVKIEVDTDKGKPTINIKPENVKILKEFSEDRPLNFNLSEIKLAFLMSNHLDNMINEIKSKTELLNSVKTGYKDETEELNNLLEPILALEKL